MWRYILIDRRGRGDVFDTETPRTNPRKPQQIALKTVIKALADKALVSLKLVSGFLKTTLCWKSPDKILK